MDYLLTMLNDLRQFDQQHKRPEPPHWLTPQDTRMIVALLSEVENVGLLVAVSTCVVNALAAGVNYAIGEEALATYLPPPPHVFRSVCAQLATADLPASISSDLQEFYTRLELAHKMTQMYTRFPAAADVKGGVHIDVLADTWRELCCKVLDVAADLRACVNGGPAADGTRWPVTARLLGAASNGDWPCVSDAGCVEVPGWAEQRRHPRWRVSWTAMLHLGVESCQVEVVDVSQGGFGLQSRQPLEAGMIVLLELDNGRRLDGRLAWVSGHKLGLMLNQPLAVNDPLLAAACQPAAATTLMPR